MTNTALLTAMTNTYEAHAYTHDYIFGFTYHGVVYTVQAGASVLPYLLKLDKASRGAGYALRFKPDTDQKIYMLTLGAQVLCSADFFDSEVASCKYNRGEVFEKMVTERAGQVWVKDNVPFTDGPDLATDDGNFQIKFEKATFCNEKQLARLVA